MVSRPDQHSQLESVTLVTYLTCCGHAQNFAPVAGPADVHRSHRDEVPPPRLQLDQTLTGGHGHDRPEGLTSETNYWHHFLLNNTRMTTLFPHLHQSVKPGKKKHTWWMNVVLKQELWRIWIMDSFQLTRVSAPLCKKKNQQRKYSNTWFDCSPKWPDEKTLTPNVRTVFSLRRTVLQELKLRIDFLGQSVSWFSSSITMGPEKSQASTTNTGWFMDEWKREAY